MTRRELKNVAASVHSRLLDQARQEGRRFDELLQYYAMERFLFRLSRSTHIERFVLIRMSATVEFVDTMQSSLRQLAYFLPRGYLVGGAHYRRWRISCQVQA